MSYRVLVGRSADRSLTRKIPPQQVRRIREAMDALADDPRPSASRKLQSREGYRLRVGNYRILYSVDDERREVFIAEVWHRQRDYR